MANATVADSPVGPCSTSTSQMPTPLSFCRTTIKGPVEHVLGRALVIVGMGFGLLDPKPAASQTQASPPLEGAPPIRPRLSNRPASPSSLPRQGLDWELVDSESVSATAIPVRTTDQHSATAIPSIQPQAGSSSASAGPILPTASRAGLTWELVTSETPASSGSAKGDHARPSQAVSAPTPEQPSAVSPMRSTIATNRPALAATGNGPTWVLVNPGDELSSSDIAREIEEKQSSRTGADQNESGSEEKDQSTVSLPAIMAISKAFTFNRTLYPDTSITIPNAFKRDPQHFFTLSLIGADQVRRPFTGCRGDNTCRDAELEAELAIVQSGPASLELLYNAASIGLSTSYSYQTLGFRLAANISPTIGLALGGESLLYLDRTSNERCSLYDSCAPFKGTSLFALASAAFPLSSKSPTPPVIVVTAGSGSGYYGYDGSGDDRRWGPIASLSFAPNQYISFAAEYTGYGISAGVSTRPFEFPLVLSLFVTDFLGNVPGYIKEYCPGNACSARLLGRFTLSF